MPGHTVIAAVVALAGTMTTIAQQKPDFSGEWQLNRHASMLSPVVAPVAQSGTLRIDTRSEPRNSFAGVAATRTMCGCSSGREPTSTQIRRPA
jgi:hypothetical protein